MLLELRALSEALQAAGIQAARRDPRLQSYGKLISFEVHLTDDGSVSSIGEIEANRLAVLRKFECSMGGSRESTPGFKVKPLFCPRPETDSEAFQKEVAQFQRALQKGTIPDRAEQLERLLGKCAPNWESATKIKKCLQEAARTLQQLIITSEGVRDSELAPLRKLLERSALIDAAQLHGQLVHHAKHAVIEAVAGIRPGSLLALLFAKDTKKEAQKDVNLVLDLSDFHSYDYPANHETVWAAVNRQLLASAPAAPAGGAASSAASGLFGEPLAATETKMPERKVGSLGKVKLRSMTKNAPCQFRYGLIEAAACPVGPEVQGELAAALEWATHPERESVTWADVSDSCGYDMAAVLIAYPSRLPPDPPQMSGFFANGRGQGVQIERKFEAFASSLVDRLEGMAKADPRTTIAVFVLAKADTARTKVLYSQQFLASRVIAAAEEWQKAARNLPPVRIRRFDENGQPCWQEPLIPFPGEVVRCLNTVWRRSGKEAEWVSGVSIGTGLTLLLEMGAALDACVGPALRQLLANSTPLLLALGHAHNNRAQVHVVPRSFANFPLLLPRTLALLLAKSGSLKGDYMARNPYLIGRLFSMVDKLHWNYCRTEREGQVPPQLLGNSLMPTALDNPVAGLARLAERLPLYLRNVPLWLRDEVAAVEREIDKDGLPSRCTDEDRAQMILGYLARPDREEPKTDNTQPPTGEPS